MKIKIKNYNNQNNILNENEDKKPSAFDMFEANVQYQYILQRKKEALPVSIVFPMGFDKPLRLPTPPEDISNIMASYQNNKARKTKNIGGVMQDPIQTFNMADACCRDAFGNFSEISFEADAEKRKLNRSDIIDNNKSNESYNYEGFPVLNETAVGAGLGAGLVLGNLASMGVQAGIGFTAGLAATVGANIALIGTGAYLTGYYGEELFGNVESGGTPNDKVAAHLNAQTQKMLSPKPADPQQYQDIVEAIGDYVKNIIEACTDVAGILTTDGASKMDELSSFVNQLLNTTSAKANEFIEAHSKQIEEEKELERKREKLKLQSDKIKSDKVKIFVVNSLTALAGSGTKNFPTDLKLLQQIQQYYENKQNKPEEVELDSALQNGGWLQLKAKYNELKKQTEKNDDNQNDVGDPQFSSLNINYNNKLNEDDDTTMSGILNKEHDAPSKLIIEADKIYNKLLLEFEDRFKKDIFSKIDTKSLPKYEETKQQMQDLIDAADKSINNKIEQITKVSSGETSGSSGLGQAAKVFLMGHPLESNNLREVWSRHLVDLKSRMTNRLTQMSDYRNKTRTLGWTWEVCRTVVPKLLARMLTYRYIYALLSNKSFFSYDTKTMEADKKAFERDKNLYIKEAESKLIWLLNQSNEYTSNGKPLLISDNINGGWVINNNLSYAYFLITRLSGINSNTKAKIATAEFLSNIKSYISNEDLVKQLLTVIINSLSSSNKLLLNSDDPEKFNQLAEIFKMPNDIKSIKGEILDTYQKLLNQRNNISPDREKLVNIAKTLDLVRSNPVKIYQACIKNQGVIDDLINKIKDQKEQDNIKAKVKEIFGNSLKIDDIKDKNYNDITIEKIQSYLPDNKNANDYYASILYLYPTLLKNNKVWDDNGSPLKTMSAKAIVQVCKVVKTLLPIEFNGLLVYALKDESEHDNKEKEIVNIFQEIKQYCEEIKNAGFNKTLIDTLNGSNPDANNAKKEYINHYKAVIKHITEKYKSLTNKELNITKFADIIEKIVKYDDKGQYKVVVDILKDIIFEKDNNKKFIELNLDEQYNILNNLLISIKSIEDLVEWQELTAAINKLKEFAEEIENSNTYPRLNSNPNNESIIYFNDKQYNILNNIYVLNEDNNENINNTESSEIEKGINVISKDENKAKEILAILKGEKDNSQSSEQINNEEIIKRLDNMTKAIVSFSL